ncbi:MAG TPA: GNAT family N-acetyltransferase [Dongiaceae bacterium]|jgi:GNAT superfamily N-acetyltransferase|nr:GNAT family N-acetyltransferase [Dongiaceae bacterium]
MTALLPLRAPEPLSDGHDFSHFDCGREELNTWLQQRARMNEGKASRTFVVCSGERVVAYYCLAAGSIARASAGRKMRQNAPDPLPVIVIGRLAVDTSYAGQKIGRALLRDAILRSLSTATGIGVRAILVHAIDDRAGGFYRKFGFQDSPTDARTLLLPIEDAKTNL